LMDAIGIDEDSVLVPKIGNGSLPLVQICLIEDPIQVFWQQIGEIPFHGLVLLLALQHFAAPNLIVEMPGQALACNRDLNSAAKADRTSTKITAQSTAANRARGSPLSGAV
jgi:hypothetical protein